ncbi:MAG: hypothetical protein ACOCSN_05180 [Halanaeroarchaeum sp.]
MSAHPTIAESDAVDDDGLDLGTPPDGHIRRTACCLANREVVNAGGTITTQCEECGRRNPATQTVRLAD